MSGVLAALRENDSHKRIVAVGHDLTSHTQAGLIDGIIRLVIAHPVREMTQALVAAMADAALSKDRGVPPSLVLPFYIHTAENV